MVGIQRPHGLARHPHVGDRPNAAHPGRRSLAGTAPLGENRSVDEIIRQCPYCELRFTYHEEVKDHILHDHPERAEVVATIEPIELPHG